MLIIKCSCVKWSLFLTFGFCLPFCVGPSFSALHYSDSRHDEVSNRIVFSDFIRTRNANVDVVFVEWRRHRRRGRQIDGRPEVEGGRPEARILTRVLKMRDAGRRVWRVFIVTCDAVRCDAVRCDVVWWNRDRSHSQFVTVVNWCRIHVVHFGRILFINSFSLLRKQSSMSDETLWKFELAIGDDHLKINFIIFQSWWTINNFL